MSYDDEVSHATLATGAIVRRTQERYVRYRKRTLVDTDRLFRRILLAQWALAVLVSLVVSPYAWEGQTRGIHMHVWLAVLLGGAIVSGPVLLTTKRPGEVATRHVVAFAQMLFSALFVHLTGGRIETHFHVFCSLAILAFYLDWRVLVTAAATVALEHFMRGVLWPESVYGIVNPEWWRFGEHALWVVVEVAFLGLSCERRLSEWRAAAEEGGLIEAMAEGEWRKQSVLERENTPTANVSRDVLNETAPAADAEE